MFDWLIKFLNGPPAYVVIYDVGDEDTYLEEYYGYFATPREAERMYRELRGTDTDYHNARICRVVRHIPDRDRTLSRELHRGNR